MKPCKWYSKNGHVPCWNVACSLFPIMLCEQDCPEPQEQGKSHCSGANPFKCITGRRQKCLTSRLFVQLQAWSQAFFKKWDMIKNGCELCCANRHHSLGAGSSWFPLTLLELLDHMLLSHTCAGKTLHGEKSAAATWLYGVFFHLPLPLLGRRGVIEMKML